MGNRNLKTRSNCSGKLVQGTWAARGFGKQCKHVRFESLNFIYKCILMPRISKKSMFSANCMIGTFFALARHTCVNNLVGPVYSNLLQGIGGEVLPNGSFISRAVRLLQVKHFATMRLGGPNPPHEPTCMGLMRWG